MNKDLNITFHIEPADRGVGIMTESFSAWENAGTCWCELDDIVLGDCTWYDNETCDKIIPQGLIMPIRIRLIQIETLLVAFANSYYDTKGYLE